MATLDQLSLRSVELRPSSKACHIIHHLLPPCRPRGYLAGVLARSSFVLLTHYEEIKPQVALGRHPIPPSPRCLQAHASVILRETSLMSVEESKILLVHSSPMNLAKENSGGFFTSSRVTAPVPLSARG